MYEAIEPVIVWRTLHQLMNAELPGDSKALDDFVWIAKSLPQADQEMAQIHAPVLGACILDKAEGLKPDLDQSDTFDKLVDLAAAFIAVVPATTWSKEPFPAEPPNPEELATALYVNRAAPETLLPKIKESVGRHIVTAVFALSRTIRPGGNSGFLTLLQVIRNLVDSDAPALAHVKAQDWVSCLSLAIQIVSRIPRSPLIPVQFFHRGFSSRRDYPPRRAFTGIPIPCLDGGRQDPSCVVRSGATCAKMSLRFPKLT